MLSFKKDAEFYYRLSQRAASKGDYIDAVFYLKRAAAADLKDVSYRLELAKTLSLITQYEQSNMIYLKMLARGGAEGKCYFGLSQNLYFLNDLEHSIYYLNLYMDRYSGTSDSEEEEDYIEIIEDDDCYDGYEIVYPFEKQDMSDSIDRARSYMKTGLFEKAMELLKKVPRGNIDYLFARNNLALCCFFLNDYNSTKAYSEEVLNVDKDNVFALCNLAAMYNYIGDSANSALYMQRFLNIGTNDITDLFKIATTLCELKEHSLALKYLKMILKQKPYDTNIMFLTALALYNNKLVSDAEDIFLKLIKLNDKDYAAKYYLKLIRQVLNEKDIESGFFQPLEYICQIPYGEMLERVKKLKSVLATTAEFKKHAADGSVTELCDWGFYIADSKIQRLIVNRFSEVLNSRTEVFLREKLIDPKINSEIKRLITEKFMLKGVTPVYSISIDYVVKSYNPQIINKGKKTDKFYQAYALAYSTLVMLMADNIEADLFNAYISMREAVESADEFKDKKALAALMAYKSKNVKLSKIKKNMCKIFKADYQVFEKYLNLLKPKHKET